jgi:hypothetical protein
MGVAELLIISEDERIDAAELLMADGGDIVEVLIAGEDANGNAELLTTVGVGVAGLLVTEDGVVALLDSAVLLMTDDVAGTHDDCKADEELILVDELILMDDETESHLPYPFWQDCGPQ